MKFALAQFTKELLYISKFTFELNLHLYYNQNKILLKRLWKIKRLRRQFVFQISTILLISYGIYQTQQLLIRQKGRNNAEDHYVRYE